MKLVSLNILMGMKFEPLMEFITEQAATTDIFCLQEVYDTPTDQKQSVGGARFNILAELKAALPEFTAYFAPYQAKFDYSTLSYVDYDLEFGLAAFVRKTIPIESFGDFFVYLKRNALVGKDPETEGKNLQYFRFEKDGKKFTVCNFHGRWFDGPKIDNPGTLEQMKLVKDFLDKEPGEKIICGDFNLNPDTESVAMLDETMVNLIKKFNITSTRPDSFPARYSRFADYVLVSPSIKIKNFEVPNLEVSDHLPMILEFD